LGVYLRLNGIATLTGLGYRGPVVVEVSVDVFDQPGTIL